MTHFLQSPAWNRFQTALGRQCFTEQGDGWSFLAIKESGIGNRRLYTPYGPHFSSLAAAETAIAALIARAKAEGVDFVRIEPATWLEADWLREHGFRPVTYQQLQPHLTQIIDVTQPRDQLLANMSQTSRNLTRNYANKGISVRTSQNPEDIQILLRFLALVAARTGISPQSASYLTTQATTLLPTGDASLYIAEYQGGPIAAALVFDSVDTRIYAHAAADDAYRKLAPGTALLGQMILDAHDKGLSYFDLYGITDSIDSHHSWAGFSAFKRSFGGTPLAYPGAWDLPLHPVRYALYRTYQSLRRRLR